MLLVDYAKDFIARQSWFNKKARCYHNVFMPRGELAEDQRTVLKDLHTFCYVGATDHGDDEIKMARAVGRREVYNWIVGHIGYESFDLDLLMRQMEEYDQ